MHNICFKVLLLVLCTQIEITSLWNNEAAAQPRHNKIGATILCAARQQPEPASRIFTVQIFASKFVNFHRRILLGNRTKSLRPTQIADRITL